ncbi:MAG: hypothetical protein OJJ54_23955 [Pseudonocardia sp.]|nr:hypothetical protein [Pseudonocardia sp.]
MDTSRKLQVSRVIDAPAADIFAILANPERHAEIDGAGMLRGVEGEAEPIAGIGQVFAMNMHQDAFGDYRMLNSVTAFVPDARIGWSPAIDPGCELAGKLGDMHVGGHTYTYDLAEGDGGTTVTQTYEWMSVKDPEFLKFFPLVSEEQLAGTLDRLAEAVG